MGDAEFREWMDGRDWDDDMPRNSRSQDSLNALLARFKAWSFKGGTSQDFADPAEQPTGAEQAAGSAATERPASPKARSTDRFSCVICYCEYSLGDQLVTLPCGHSFHQDCVGRWLRRSSVCPCCRNTVES